jgi:hypothetical protein
MLKPETFESNQQFINAWSYFARTCPQGKIVEVDKLAIAWSDTDNVFFNTMFFSILSFLLNLSKTKPNWKPK